MDDQHGLYRCERQRHPFIFVEYIDPHREGFEILRGADD